MVKRAMGIIGVVVLFACGRTATQPNGNDAGPEGSPGDPIVLASVPGPGSFGGGIAVDAKNVYFTTVHQVIQVPIAGGAPVVLVDGGPTAHQVFGVAVDATRVYWANQGDGFNFRSNVNAVPIGGGAVTTLAEGSYNPSDVAVEGTTLYWANASLSTLWAVPAAGGPGTALVDDSSTHGDLTSVAADSASVYFGEYYQDDVAHRTMYRVARVPRGGGTATTIATVAEDDPGYRAHAIAVDGTNAYWLASQCPGTGTFCDTIAVMKAPLAGGPPSVIATTEGIAFGLSIAIDASNVYFTVQVPSCKPDGGCDNSAPPGGVMKAPIAGGAASFVALAGAPLGVAVDATNLYWIDFNCDGATCLKKLSLPK